MRIRLQILIVGFVLLQACSNKRIDGLEKVVYVMDPQCGWCYGNSNNISEVYNHFKDSVRFELLVGGMWTGSGVRKGNAKLEEYIKPRAKKMEDLSGEKISDKYYQLVSDSTQIFSSFEPCAAIVIVKRLAPNKVFEFAREVQKALFEDGKNLNKIDSYLPILADMSIDTNKFKVKWMGEQNLFDTQREFAESEKFANGFPSLKMVTQTDTIELASGYFNKNKILKKFKGYF